MRQQILSPTGMAKLRQRLEVLAHEQLDAVQGMDRQIQALRTRRAETHAKLAVVGNNMALAPTPEAFTQISKVFNELTAMEKQLTADLEAPERQVPTVTNPKAQVDAAMEVVGSLSRLTENWEDMASAKTAFDMVNARLFCHFGQALWGKRIIRKATGGILTFGQEPPPVQVYQGPTTRWALKGGLNTAKKV
jgi:hypothetical protein